MRYVYIGIFLFISIGSLFFYYMRTKDDSFASEHKLSIVCTTGMIQDVTRHIAKELITVHGLMGPGVDPHLYRARAGDMQKLMHADIILYNGLHLEGKMAEVFESLQAYKRVHAVSDTIEIKVLRPAEHENMYDPHIWHDVVLWMQVAEYIGLLLGQYDSENREIYIKNMHAYVAELQKLNAHVQNLINDIPQEKRILVTAHDAFGYFGARYGLEVVGLQGISTDADVGAKDIQKVVDLIIEKDVPAIFVESSIPQRTVQAVQDAVVARGKYVAIGNELFSDALGDDDADNYIGMIMHNVRAIHAALKVS